MPRRRDFLKSSAAGLATAIMPSGDSAAGRPGRGRHPNRRQQPHPAQGRNRPHARPRARRLRNRRRADRGHEDRGRRTQPQGRSPDDRRLEHDRHAGVRRHAPSPVRNDPAQHPPRRPPERTQELRLGHPGDLYAGVPARRRAHLGARRLAQPDQRRRDDGRGHVAGVAHAGTHRRVHRRPAGGGTPDAVRVLAGCRLRRAVSAGHPPAADAVLRVERSAAHAGDGRRPRPRAPGRSPGRSARRSSTTSSATPPASRRWARPAS